MAQRRKELGFNFRIEIDGGMGLDNVADVAQAGCDWIVTGSSIFHTPDPEAAFREMQRGGPGSIAGTHIGDIV